VFAIHMLVGLGLYGAGELPMQMDITGILGGILISFSTLFALLAVEVIGLSVATAIWCGFSGVVAFTWAKGIWGQPVADLSLSLFGLALVTMGVVSVSLLSHQQEEKEDAEERQPLQSKRISQCCRPSKTGMHAEPALESQPRGQLWKQYVGTALALLCGLFGGSSLVPLHYSTNRGLVQLPSYGFGFLLTGLFITSCSSFYWGELRCGSFQGDGWGIIEGILWGVGNILSIVASESSLGVGIAQPIREAYTVVCAIGGILIFKEMRDTPTLIKFSLAVLAVVAGNCTLAIFGDPNLKVLFG